MRLKLLADRCNFLVPMMFFLFMLFMPLSITVKSIFFGLGVASILSLPYYNQNLWYAYNTFWGRIAVLFFVFVVVACLWSPAPFSMDLSVVSKYCKLIYLPLLAVGFMNPKARFWCINGYFMAMVITFITSILKLKGLIAIGEPQDLGDLFYNHIATGFMMALASYLAALFACTYTGKARIVYSLIVLMASYQVLFINTGRTGYAMYFILMGLFFIQKLSFKKAVLAIALFSGGMLLVYNQSSVMQIGIGGLISDFKFFEHNKPNTSLGYRIQFHNYAESLFLKHPIIGIGTGGFKYSFSQDQPIPAWGKELNDPHSQYWMTLSEQGLIGMLFFLSFLGSLFIASLQLTETRPILWGILAAFCIGSFSDTILCFSTAGYLLIVLSAICLGELLEKKESRLVRESANDSSMDQLAACK